MPPKKRRNLKQQINEGRKKIDFKTSVSYHEFEQDYHISSSYSETALTIKPQDIKQKLMIASNVTSECKETKANLLSGKSQEYKIESVMKRLQDHTNLPLTELKIIYNRVVTRDRSFAKVLKDIRGISEPALALVIDDIRNLFVKFILEQKQFPSKMDLMKDLKEVSAAYCNENISIQKLIRSKLLKYQHFPEFNRYLLTEHPERVYQRTMYLSSVKLLRAQQRNFVYVEIRRIIPRGAVSGFIAGLAAFPISGTLEKFFTKDSTDPIAKKWLQQRILPLVPENCVIILSQPNTRNKLTPSAKKSDLIAWLDQNGIPYGKNPNTAELYSLFKKFKGNFQQEGVYDHVFLNVGLAMVHFPSEWRNLNFFKFIWSDINVADAYHPGRPETLKQKILNATAAMLKLNTIEESLIEEEMKMMKEDSLMEEIIENVQEMVKNGDVQTLEFPKECIGDKTDCFEMHVSDYVLDFACE